MICSSIKNHDIWSKYQKKKKENKVPIIDLIMASVSAQVTAGTKRQIDK